MADEVDVHLLVFDYPAEQRLVEWARALICLRGRDSATLAWLKTRRDRLPELRRICREEALCDPAQLWLPYDRERYCGVTHPPARSEDIDLALVDARLRRLAARLARGSALEWLDLLELSRNRPEGDLDQLLQG